MISSNSSKAAEVLQSPGCAHGTCQHIISGGIIDEAFLDRVPFQLSAEKHCDITQMAKRGRAMSDFRCANRVLSAFNAIQEVLHMVPAFV